MATTAMAANCYGHNCYAMPDGIYCYAMPDGIYYYGIYYYGIYYYGIYYYGEAYAYSCSTTRAIPMAIPAVVRCVRAHRGPQGW